MGVGTSQKEGSGGGRVQQVTQGYAGWAHPLHQVLNLLTDVARFAHRSHLERAGERRWPKGARCAGCLTRRGGWNRCEGCVEAKGGAAPSLDPRWSVGRSRCKGEGVGRKATCCTWMKFSKHHCVEKFVSAHWVQTLSSVM